MKLYLDNCCYNRPYDDQAQERVHLEGEAILAIITKYKQNDEIIGSPALELEMSRIKSVGKREKVESLYSQTVNKRIEYSVDIFKRVSELSKQTSIRRLDCFHLSFAESGKADALLTTDDRFIRACLKLTLNVRVLNPLNFLLER